MSELVVVEEMPLNFAKFKTFDDFVKFVANSQIPFIYHTTVKGKAVYFVHILLVEGMVYYFEQEGPIKDRYAVYNRFRDQVSFTDRLEVDPQKVILLILEVEATSLFPEQ
ncbi:hypothetical protein MUP77_03480 [Candidatus Bathyarchaeota archaeon]|nr:hypothetical protein [Candidatus Bathyarchaeota archaeon]